MDSLPRCETNNSLGLSSTLVAPTKVLRHLHMHAIPNIGLQEVSCNTNQGLVTGINLPRTRHCLRPRSHYEDHPYASFHKGSSEKSSLRHPDYSLETTRYKSFRHWDGLIPPHELAEAGFYMIARNQVKCFSCGVLAHVLDWRRGDSAVDIHHLYSPNCGFIKELLNTVRIVEASRDSAEITNYHSSCEKPLITTRVKKEGPSVNSALSVTSKTEHPSSIIPDNVSKPLPGTTKHLIIPGMNYLPSQQSMSTLANLPKSSTKSTDAIMHSPPREQIVLVSCQVEVFVMNYQKMLT